MPAEQVLAAVWPRGPTSETQRGALYPEKIVVAQDSDLVQRSIRSTGAGSELYYYQNLWLIKSLFLQFLCPGPRSRAILDMYV